MSHSDRCPNCGALVLPEERFCKQCGARLEEEPAASSEAAAPYTGGEPQTIEQLKAFCAYNEMPLEKMRFFVGVDYKQPKAFGIYRDGDRFVVYKNKADGSRAVRYHGPDEAHAVKELYDKLLDECHKRDIWPDGKPADYEARKKKEKRKRNLMLALIIVVVLAFTAGSYLLNRHAHRYDGYYSFDDPGMYYRYGDDWYYDDGYYGWLLVDDFGYDGYAYDDYYLGAGYDGEWGVTDFKTSSAWASIQEESSSHTTSSDYSSWDSGGTDWDSDW